MRVPGPPSYCVCSAFCFVCVKPKTKKEKQKKRKRKGKRKKRKQTSEAENTLALSLGEFFSLAEESLGPVLSYILELKHATFEWAVFPSLSWFVIIFILSLKRAYYFVQALAIYRWLFRNKSYATNTTNHNSLVRI